MAKLYIAEFSGPMLTADGPIAVGRTPPITEQTVAIGGTSAQSAAFDAATQLVRVHADAICSIAFGSNPTATTSTARLAQNQTEYFAVNHGNKIAVISNT